MNDSRFEQLLSQLIDEGLTQQELDELLQGVKDNPERQQELQSQLEVAEWLAQSKDDLRDSSLFLATIQSRLSEDNFVSKVSSAISQPRVRWPWMVAVAAVILIFVSIVWLWPRKQPEMVRLVGMNGSLQWTGDGGQVERNLQIGHLLGGGTLESLSADSWAVLEFHDGSTVTVFGQTMLTFSHQDRKELHLRQGKLSAHVKPQPIDKPMLIHSPTARLEVLGTQFNVDVEATSTLLNVNEGRVRVTRLSDGQVLEVPANHQVVATVHRSDKLQLRQRSDPVHAWKSEMPMDVRYGKWLPKSGLHAMPMLLPRCDEPPLLLYLTAFSVSSGDSSPVVLKENSRFRIRGRMKNPGEIYFGLTLHHRKDGFAGKYLANRKVLPAQVGEQPFEIEIDLAEFKAMKDLFPETPIDLELSDCWCLTVHEDRGLEILSIELISDD